MELSVPGIQLRERRSNHEAVVHRHELTPHNLAETEQDIQRRSWRDLLLSAKERYQSWKKGLMERTNESLEAVAEQYVSLPDDYSRVRRAVEAARNGLSLRNAVEIGIRAALPAAEFSTQMAAKQFFVDIAVRQAEYSKTVERYQGLGGVEALEAEAADFAEAVRAQLDQIQQFTAELPGSTNEAKEQFRQKKIEHCLRYAEEQLAKSGLISADAKTKILRDLRVHLDTVVFDPSRSTILQGYDRVFNGQRRALDGIVRKHIDAYQHRKARNLSVATTAARWLTFGVESFVVGKAAAIKGALQQEYDAALMQLPATERTAANRMLAFARSTREALTRYTLNDEFRNMYGKHRRLEQLLTELTVGQHDASAEQFDVDSITAKLWQTYSTEFERTGTTEQELYERIEDFAYQQGDRRKAMGDWLKYKLFAWHKEAIRGTMTQFEHVYQKVNDTIISYGVLQQTDQLIAHAGDASAVVEQALMRLESAYQDVVVTVAHPTEAPTVTLNHTVVDEVVHIPAEALPTDVEDVPEPAVISDVVGNAPYEVASGDNAWSIAKQHIEAYRVREHNSELSIAEAVRLLAKDNHLNDASALREHQLLVVPVVGGESVDGSLPIELVDAFTAPKETLVDYIRQAEAMDAGDHSDHFVYGANRHNLDQLPAGEYTFVFGQRYSEGKTGNAMPVDYDAAYTVKVTAEGTTVTAVGGDGSTLTLEQLLQQERSPIVRVLHAEDELVALPTKHIQSQEWSEYNRAMAHYLQTHAIRVVEKDGTYCAKDVAGRMNLFGDHLAAELGMDVLSAHGERTGVTVHAPMIAEAIQTAGGTEVATLERYFDISNAGATKLKHDASYDAALTQWIHAAAESPLRVATFLFSGTHIQDIIAANRAHGGEPNSHAVTLLGEKDIQFEVHRDGRVSSALIQALGISRSDFAERGHLFEALGIEVNGHPITTEADWDQIALQAGDRVVVHDVALNHRFGADVSDTLVTMMVRNESLSPVSVLEPNADVVNQALAQPELAHVDFPVSTFVEIESGMSFADAMRSANVSPDVWQATAYALAERGLDVNHVQPGDLIPVYDEGALRDALDALYERAEERIEATQIAGVYTHIVRPYESMDHITQQYFNRGMYSAAEWAQLRDGLAQVMQVPHGERQMPGDAYVQPYTVKEYHLVADKAYTITENDIAALDKVVWTHRSETRVYLPDTLPVTVDGEVVTTPFPEEVRRLIDTAVDQNPEYSEHVRAALALVYSNEGLRETADLTVVSSAVAWVNEHLPNRSATLDNLIGKIEYVCSRQMLKDAAWKIQDTPWLKASLDFTLAMTQAEVERGYIPGDLDEMVLDKLETIANVSSAGLFQVRANNFVPEHSSHFDAFEDQLRNDPLMNTQAAAEMLHRGEQAWDTYLAAIGEHTQDDEAKTLAVLNSYNGGPFKTLLGGVQDRLLQFAQHEHIETQLHVANGRDVATTQSALLALHERLYEQGKVDVSPEQAKQDVALLGKETVGFLRSDTMQAIKGAYTEAMGEPFSVLPDADRLSDATVTYANYALLATRGDAMAVIQQHSSNARVAEATRPKAVPAQG